VHGYSPSNPSIAKGEVKHYTPSLAGVLSIWRESGSSWVPQRKLQRSSDLFQEFIERKPITGAPGPADIAMANDPAQWNVVTLA